MTTYKRRMLCGLITITLLAAAAVELLHWADRQFAARLAQETYIRFQDGVLLDREFAPLSPEDSMVLFQHAAGSQLLLLSTVSPASPAEVLIPYLPDYGSELELSTPDANRWRLSYRTLDGLEVAADYTHAGQEWLSIYLPAPDLEVRLDGGVPPVMDYTSHARRPVTPSLLWTALRTELSYQF